MDTPYTICKLTRPSISVTVIPVARFEWPKRTYTENILHWNTLYWWYSFLIKRLMNCKPSNFLSWVKDWKNITIFWVTFLLSNVIYPPQIRSVHETVSLLRSWGVQMVLYLMSCMLRFGDLKRTGGKSQPSSAKKDREQKVHANSQLPDETLLIEFCFDWSHKTCED